MGAPTIPRILRRIRAVPEQPNDPSPNADIPEETLEALIAREGVESSRTRKDGPVHSGHDELAEIWRLSAPPEGSDGWPALAARIDRESGRQRAVSRRVAWRPAAPLLAAAVVVVCLGLGLIVSRLRDGTSTGRLTIVSVPAAAMDTVHLAGGIVVYLNSVSSLTYAAGDVPVREVVLDGEAYFDIPHDPAREFVVQTAAGEIRDLGTEFNVLARDGSVRVVVAEGEVELEAGGRKITIPAGHQSLARKDQAPADAAAVEASQARAWLRGDLVVIDQPLGEVAAEIERRYAVKVRVTPALRERRITASVRATSAAAAIRAICLAVSAHCQAADSGWSISRPDPMDP
jgi:transmembrane sensor